MIAIDSSVVVDHLLNHPSPQRAQLRKLLSDNLAVLAPATVTELFSAPNSAPIEAILPDFVILPILPGYWERAGLLRSKVKKAGRKAALGDALIAQACIDSDVPLLTRDADFSAFAKLGGLKLA